MCSRFNIVAAVQTTVYLEFGAQTSMFREKKGVFMVHSIGIILVHCWYITHIFLVVMLVNSRYITFTL